MERSIERSMRATVKAAIVIAAAAVLLLAASPGFSQETGFLHRLQAQLQAAGWTKEDVGQLEQQQVDWSQAEGANPEVVALALSLGKREDADMGPLEQAHLAIEVALAAVRMKSLGLDDRVTAMATLEGVRQALYDIQALRENAGENPQGEVLRTRVRLRLQEAADQQTRTQAQVQTRQATRSGPEHVDAPAPPEPGSGPGSQQR